MTLTLKQATIVALLLGICWSKEVWAKKSSFTNRILEELRSQISKETNQNLELSAVSERNLNPMLEKTLHLKQRTDDNKSDKEDTFGQTILINGKEYKPKIPDGSNPMNLETRNLQQEPRQEQRMIKRNFEVDIQKKLWANNKVPYVIIETSFGNNVATAKSLINAAIQQFKESTCVEWVPRTDETYYVKFIGNDYGCYATVGFKPFSRGQIINYAAGCLEIESVLHEMYHTIGGNHEVQRLDRSSYLTVLWDNTKQFQFKQYVVDKVTRDRFPYDYHSVMQYRMSTFPRYAGQNTLKLKDPELDYLATKPKKGLSYIDIAEINDAYQCTEGCTNKCQHGGFPIKPVGGTCKCKCPSGLKGDSCEEVDTSNGCGGIITLETGKEKVITIQAYQQGRECTWLFKGGQRSIIRVYVTAVDLPYDSTKQCQHWLEFRDYHIGTPGKKLCGRSEEGIKLYAKDVEEDPAMMMMRFNTKTHVSSTEFHFFQLTVTAYPSGCVSSPCKNGASCAEGIGHMAYVCYCKNGFTGTNCERFEDDSFNSCDFSRDFYTCLVHQDIANSDFFWLFTTYICPDANCNTGIYTSQSVGNQFLTINPLYNQYKLYNKKSYLISDVQFSEKVRCLTFHYNIGENSNGDYQTIVRVHREGQGKEGITREQLWEVNSSTNYTWNKASIDIHSMRKLKIVIEAVMGPQELGIDNMKLRPGLCQESACNPNPCKNGGTCKSSGNPAKAYTCICSTGYTGINCEEISYCSVNPCRNGGECRPIGTGTQGGCVCKHGYSGQNCEVQGTPCSLTPCKNGGTCVPAISGDDMPYTCNCLPGYIGENCEVVTCTFETDKWCGVESYGLKSDRITWTIHEGPTPSPSTGPMKAAEGKRYLYLEGSGVDAGAWSQFHMIRENDVTEGDFCLSFYYSMVGTDVGDLKVILFDSNIWNYRLKLTRSGPQIGGEWLKYEETVTMYKHTYILFYGQKTSSGFRSDIAIDNIQLKPGQC